jgi:hypothetical protein
MPCGKQERGKLRARGKVGRGDWGKGELQSAGGSQTVVPMSTMLKGDEPKVDILDHKNEVIGKVSGKMGKTQRVMSVGA